MPWPVPKEAIDVAALGQAGLSIVNSATSPASLRNVANWPMLLEIVLSEEDLTGQNAVWQEVEKLQTKLQRSVGGAVKSQVSPSSLQLTLENQKVLAEADKYVAKLLPSTTGHEDVIGYLFVINGRIKSADVYGHEGLFKQLWPKLLQTAAVEALADLDPEKKFEPVGPEAVASFLEYASEGFALSRDVSKQTRLVLRPRTRSLYFETVDPARPDVWMHRSYMPRGG
jgi:hypothetical protein